MNVVLDFQFRLGKRNRAVQIFVTKRNEARLEAAKVAVIDAAPSDNRHTIETMFNTLVG